MSLVVRSNTEPKLDCRLYFPFFFVYKVLYSVTWKIQWHPEDIPCNTTLDGIFQWYPGRYPVTLHQTISFNPQTRFSNRGGACEMCCRSSTWKIPLSPGRLDRIFQILWLGSHKGMVHVSCGTVVPDRYPLT